MTTQKLEYDSTLGGPVVLANHVLTYRYAASAIEEIRQLVSEVRNPTSTKLIFQTLPKHMRRRAMSHHPKRLPRKYRTAHKAQMAKAGKPQPTKRPSRKHRRRPGNLLREYLRRQRRYVWLETHIWHARRFHMVERWGYRLPYASCDKTFRACYRASAEHCLLQDISFLACVQIIGSLAELRVGFARLSSANCGLSITAKTWISGRREGSIELFRSDKYPEGALGRLSFLWRPLDEDVLEEDNAKRTLWLWVHPSGYQAVLAELVKVFELISMKTRKVELQSVVLNLEERMEEITPEAIKKAFSDKKQKTQTTKTQKTATIKEQQRLQFVTKTQAYERIKRYTNVAGTMELSELKDTMNRFRLTGPLSQSVLSHAFKVKTLPIAGLNKSTDNSWLHEQLSKAKNFRHTHETQASYWQRCSQLTSPAELLSNMVIALNIEDPRLQRPQRRSKALPTFVPNGETITDVMLNTPSCLPQSSIWNAKLRDHICEAMVSTQTYCELRAKHAVVPGGACAFERELQAVPVLLIQRPGSQQPQYKRLGYGCGWDVIAPAGYGMPIWLTLIMWGAKAGGLREFDTLARESGTEQHLPDTVAGLQTMALRHTELQTKYFRKPSNKRCNYRKFAIASPFRVPYTQLVRDWLPAEAVSGQAFSADNFHILRDRALLQKLNSCLQHVRNKPTTNLDDSISSKCLIQLQLRMKTRGNLNDNALICLPTRADFKRNLKLIKREQHDPVYTEPLLPDPNEKERKQLRQVHKRMLKRLRARRIREKRTRQETSTKRVYIRPAGTAKIISTQFSKMCDLWLPSTQCDSLFSVRKQCSREVFGYISSASFSYTEATVCAVGYVTWPGLKQLLTLCRQAHLKRPMCLVRATHSRHYRFASFKLNLEV